MAFYTSFILVPSCQMLYDIREWSNKKYKFLLMSAFEYQYSRGSVVKSQILNNEFIANLLPVKQFVKIGQRW